MKDGDVKFFASRELRKKVCEQRGEMMVSIEYCREKKDKQKEVEERIRSF